MKTPGRLASLPAFTHSQALPPGQHLYLLFHLFHRAVYFQRNYFRVFKAIIINNLNRYGV
jgi:hypothetical protein